MPPPLFSFTFHTSLSPWNIPCQQWLRDHHCSNLNGLATGSLVFDPQGRILLIQRAGHDSMPNMWEVPGGAVDDDDPTVLHGAARELWEEAGLVATNFTHLIRPAITSGAGADTELGHIFTNRLGTKTFCRFSFVTEVESCAAVQLDPNEHQAFVWATADEIQQQRMHDGLEIPITHESVRVLILEAFRLREGLAE